ncbi:TRAP transporter small permease [Salipiger abyssi]|uniref:TRAP transporter small permease n=1 Tax=Salipiger abyssi TaxID=1250539 RepID=UPI001A8CA267|nr:TRAP transporter small permease subunit [Salipiger abyssi]MBN9887184.1 TRAP transporter small permease subunit [Salipiger abyssi]
MTRIRTFVDGVEAFLRAAETLLRVAVIAILAVMLMMNGANILLRGVFDRSLNIVFPLTVFLFVWMSFLGFYLVYREKRDIQVTFIVGRLSRRGRQAARLMIDLLAAGLMLLLLVNMPRVLGSQVGQILLLPIERYWLTVPLCLSAALVLLHFLTDMTRLLFGIRTPGADPSSDLYIPEA